MDDGLTVDLIIDLESSSDIHPAFDAIKANGYVSHDTKYQDLLVVHTKNGVIAVRSENPTFLFGLIVNIHNIKRQEILNR